MLHAGTLNLSYGYIMTNVNINIARILQSSTMMVNSPLSKDSKKIIHPLTIYPQG